MWVTSESKLKMNWLYLSLQVVVHYIVTNMMPTGSCLEMSVQNLAIQKWRGLPFTVAGLAQRQATPIVVAGCHRRRIESFPAELRTYVVPVCVQLENTHARSFFSSHPSRKNVMGKREKENGHRCEKQNITRAIHDRSSTPYLPTSPPMTTRQWTGYWP